MNESQQLPLYCSLYYFVFSCFDMSFIALWRLSTTRAVLYLQELSVDLELGYGPTLVAGSLAALLYTPVEVAHSPGDDAQVLHPETHIEACAHGVGLA